MIAKISKGRGFGGVIRYVLGEDKDFTMLDGAKQCHGSSPDEIASSFQKIAKRGKSQIPVRHFSIGFGENDNIDGLPIDNDTKSEIVNRLMSEMGFGDCQYFAVAHGRTDPSHSKIHHHDHIHIVANAITPNGERVNDSWDYYKIQTRLREIEKDYGFERVQNSFEKTRISLPVNETELQRKIDRSLSGNPNLKTWIDRMEAEGVNLRFKVTSRGHIQGVSYLSEGEMIKGGDAGRGWKSLSKEFVKSPDDKILVKAANLKTQVIPVVLKQEPQELLNRTANLAMEKLKGEPKYKDKSVEIKLSEGILTVWRLRPDKRIFSAIKDDNGEWKSFGVPDIDKKKDVSLLISEKPQSLSLQRSVLISDGDPVDHLMRIAAQSDPVTKNAENNHLDLPEKNLVVIEEEMNEIVVEIPPSPIPVNESIETTSVVNKSIKNKSKDTYSK